MPSSWRDATELVRSMNKRFFTNLDDDDWEAVARQLFKDRDGRPAQAYDYKLGNALSEIDISQKIPTMWTQFEAVKRIPVLVLRGENSDILSARTVLEMERRHPRLASITVHAQGHAPLLKDRFTLGIIADFLRETDPGNTVDPKTQQVAPHLPHMSSQL